MCCSGHDHRTQRRRWHVQRAGRAVYGPLPVDSPTLAQGTDGSETVPDMRRTVIFTRGGARPWEVSFVFPGALIARSRGCGEPQLWQFLASTLAHRGVGKWGLADGDPDLSRKKGKRTFFRS
jgi:hypothetical protein